MEKRKEKAKESIQAVLPILFIVLLLSFTVAPVSASILLEFMIGAVFVIIGMLFFSMGAEMSMSPMGERVGGSMLKTKKLWVILLLGFFLGVISFYIRKKLVETPVFMQMVAMNQLQQNIMMNLVNSNLLNLL